MKWLIRLVTAIALLIGVVAAAGWMLPVSHQASRSAEFRRPPADVYALVADVREYPAWWSEVSKVDVLAETPRLRFRDHMSTGPVVMAVQEAAPPSKFVTVIDDPDQPFGGTWTFEIVPTPSGGSRLTITERGEIYNPVFRALARFVFGYTGSIEGFLAAAQARLQ
jgi:ribosome-associated toxin RatA of RatAB toxin-antitoxin module